MYNPFSPIISDVIDQDSVLLAEPSIASEYEPKLINRERIVKSHECKAGILKPHLYPSKFNADECEFIDRCNTDRPLAKIANELISGNITASDFTTACSFLHKLINWRKGLMVEVLE